MHVVVVGAGIVGAAIAFRLTRAGCAVSLIDPRPGHGATRAAAGMLTPVGEAWHGEVGLSSLLAASAARYPRFVDEVRRCAGREPGYRTTPTMICGVDAADRDMLRDLHELAGANGLRSRELTVREGRRLEPSLSPRLSCVYLAPDDHQVDPRTLCTALLQAVVAGRGEVLEEAVTGLTVRPHGVRLASGRTVAADAVVLANALGAGALHPDLAVQRPVYGDVVRLAPAQRRPALLQSTVRGLISGTPVYLVPRADGSVVLGATMREDGDSRVSAGGLHELLRTAVVAVPGVVDLAVDELIARPRPGTPDNAPLLGELAPGVVAATGFHRHGVTLAPLAADAVAGLLDLPTDHVPGLGACDPRRFGTTEEPWRSL